MSAGPKIIKKLVSAPDETILLARIAGEVQPPMLVTFVNPYSYQVLRGHGDLVAAMDAMYADGITLAKVVSVLTGIRVTRRSFDMTSLAGLVFSECASNGRVLGVVGGKPAEVAGFRDRMLQQYPSIRCAVARSGYFASDSERDACIDELATERVEVLVCGMGTLLQERFLMDASGRVPSLRVGITCGGFIHQGSVSLRYYPRFVNVLHLRWAYRLLREPATRARFFEAYPRFVRVFVGDWRAWRRDMRLAS